MIVAGFGYRTGASESSLRTALALAQARAPHVTALAAPADKTSLLVSLAEVLAVPLIAVTPEATTAMPVERYVRFSAGTCAYPASRSRR